MRDEKVREARRWHLNSTARCVDKALQLALTNRPSGIATIPEREAQLAELGAMLGLYMERVTRLGITEKEQERLMAMGRAYAERLLGGAVELEPLDK